ncbi:MAG: hypothetical protein K5921_07995, partial [Lachnospiraceae bacterium]|nr:hypothetical protein [Lachnospiraceae bacterium]
MRKRLAVIFASVIVLFLAFFSLSSKSYAYGPTDEILNYTITVDVNDDATLDMNYHIEWKVLQSGGDLGPVTWVEIGIPNDHCENLTAQSDNIKKIALSRKGGDVLAKITFDKAYYEGEVISFDYSLTQDYMYEINKLTDGETVYTFTPGWFDEIDVDELIIKWNADKVKEFSPSAEKNASYIVWKSALKKRDKYTVSITYPNDAYGFDMSKTYVQEEDKTSP